MTTITVTQQPATATVSGSTVSANVPASTPAVAVVTGGVGPRGASGGYLSDLLDVQVGVTAENDLLRYRAGKWKNIPESEPLDGGNY